MVCIGSCVIASALLGSSVMFMVKGEDRAKHDRLVSLLSEEQVEIYEFIKRERAKLYVTGLIIGIIMGIMYLRLFKSGITWKIDCGFIAIVMGVAGAYYSIMPKTTYMLSHLDGKEQVNAWLDVYKEMKNRCHMGMLMGVLALPLLARGVK
tara:strand:+ start:8954 stop:9406 length:453 start_codon:yes stop_codon:yes gene_type:complete